MMRTVTLALAVTLGTGSAVAQPFARTVDVAQRRMADDERTRAWVLLGEGALSTAAGVPLAIAGDETTRWAGIMTAGFGVVNLALAIPWLVRIGDDDRAVPGETELATRLRRSRAAHRTSAVFALNVGLDVLYVAAGVTAWALGAREGSDGARGGGIAAVAKGTFLLGFDLWGWIASDRNAARFVE